MKLLLQRLMGTPCLIEHATSETQAAPTLPAEILALIPAEPGDAWTGFDQLLAWTTQQGDIDAQDALWTAIARHWLERLNATLAPGQPVYESKSVLLAGASVAVQGQRTIAFAQSALQRIHRGLKKIARRPLGKQVILLFDDRDLYHAYACSDLPEGEFAGSGGIYISEPFGHLALPVGEPLHMEATIAHELTHASLFHLPLPPWLNEGFAVSFENALSRQSQVAYAGFHPMHGELTRELRDWHHRFWNPERIQTFWTGEGFLKAGEDWQELSYSLALVLTELLAKEFPQEFLTFAQAAHFSDAGEGAALEILECSLGDIVSIFLGEGDWAPSPPGNEDTTLPSPEVH